MFYGCNKLDDSNFLNIKKHANILTNSNENILFSGEDDFW